MKISFVKIGNIARSERTTIVIYTERKKIRIRASILVFYQKKNEKKNFVFWLEAFDMVGRVRCTEMYEVYRCT